MTDLGRSHEGTGGPEPRRVAPRRARLQAGAQPLVERLPELRDLLHDHLGPRRLLHDLLPGVEQRRPDRDLVGLADHLGLHPHHRLLHGRARLGVPDRGRHLLVVVEARQPDVGLVHRLVQPARADRDPRLGRLLLRAVPGHRARPLQRRLPGAELRRRPAWAAGDVRAVRADPRAARLHQHPRQPPRRGVQRHLRLVAPRRRRGDHRHPHLRPRQPRELQRRSSPTASTTRASASRCSGGTCCRSASC